MPDVWDVPASYPTTPGLESGEGLPNAPGYDESHVYDQAGARAITQLQGTNYQTGGVTQEPEDIEGGRFNEMRRMMYDAYKRLWEAQFLAGLWPYAYINGWLVTGEEEDIGFNYTYTHEFEAYGSGTAVTIKWNPDDPLQADARALPKPYGPTGSCCVHPGIVAADERNGTYGLAIITDGRFVGSTPDGYNHLQLDLHRPLKPSREGKIWLFVQEKLPPFPPFTLRIDDADAKTPPQCKHAIKTFHTFYSTFKTYYASAPACAGILDDWFCAKLDQDGVDLSRFVEEGGRCNNTHCPYYRRQTPWYPGTGSPGTVATSISADTVEVGGIVYECILSHTSGTWATDLANDYWQVSAETSGDAWVTATVYLQESTRYSPGNTDNAFSKFFLSRGSYMRDLTPGGWAEGHEFLRIGLDDWEGLFTMIGLPIGYWPQSVGSIDVGGSAILTRRDYRGVGLFLKRTEEATGYDTFTNWYQDVKTIDADGDEPTDNVGLLEDLEVVDKHDPAGGNGPGASDLLTTRPGYDYERTVGIGRSQHIGTTEMREVSGPGIGMRQRVKQSKYTSPSFQAAPFVRNSQTDDWGQTTLAMYDTPQELSEDTSFEFDLVWEIPRYGERVNYAATRRTKPVSGSIGAWDITGDVLRVEFNLGAIQVCSGGSKGGLWPATYIPPDYYDCHCAGNVVKIANAIEIINPAAGNRVLGDRQSGLYPGDTMTLDVPALRDVAITCVWAKGMAGVPVTVGVTQPFSGAPGIMDYVDANWNKRDVAYFALEGRGGELIREWFVRGGALALGDVPIDKIAHSAISPPQITATGVSTSYEPVLKRTEDGTTTTTLTAGTDYVYDPTDGKFYVDTSGWAAGHTWHLHFEGYVMDARKTYPCEDAKACREALKQVLTPAVGDGAFVSHSGLFTQEQIAICTVRKSDNAIMVAYVLSGPFTNNGYPTYASFAWPGRPQVMHVPYHDTSLYEIQWRKIDWVAAGYGTTALMGDDSVYTSVGQNSHSGWTNPATALESRFNYRSWMWRLDLPQAWAAGQIKKALVNVDLGSGGLNATAYAGAYSCTITGTGPLDAWEVGTLTALETVPISIGVYKVTTAADESLSFVSLGRGVLANLTKVTTGGDDYLQGTVDITVPLKAAYNYYFTLADNEEIVLMLVGDATGGGAALGVWEQFTGWTGPWTGTWDGGYTGQWEWPVAPETPQGTFSSFSKSCKYIEAGAIALETVHLQMDWAGMGAINYPINAEGHSHGPNIMAGV